MTELDRLLFETLRPIPDAGFSARVMMRVKWQTLRRNWTVAAVLGLCTLLVVFLVPWGAVGVALGAALPGIAGLWAFNLAAALVVISLLAARELARLV